MTSKEIKAEAHRIRNEAAARHGLKAKEICFISCWNMARLGQALPWEVVEITVLETIKADKIRREDGSKMPVMWAERNDNANQVVIAFPGDQVTGNGETYTITALYLRCQGEKVCYRFQETKLEITLDQLYQAGATRC